MNIDGFRPGNRGDVLRTVWGLIKHHGQIYISAQQQMIFLANLDRMAENQREGHQRELEASKEGSLERVLFALGQPCCRPKAKLRKIAKSYRH